MLECGSAIADTVESLLDSWPDEEEDDSMRSRKLDLHRKFRAMHRDFHSSLNEACNRLARAGLTSAKIAD